MKTPSISLRRLRWDVWKLRRTHPFSRGRVREPLGILGDVMKILGQQVYDTADGPKKELGHDESLLLNEGHYGLVAQPASLTPLRKLGQFTSGVHGTWS